MKKSNRGFTLLELLLVVGIAAVLIVAGITTYSLVSKSNTINETVRLTNVILQQTRRLYSGQASYGAASVEAALVNTGNIPPKYVTGTDITSPYSSAAGAVTVTGNGTAGTFTLVIQVPNNQASEIGAQFDPNSSNEITSITVCGLTTNDGTAMTALATLATTCGNTSTLANMSITSR